MLNTLEVFRQKEIGINPDRIELLHPVEFLKKFRWLSDRAERRIWVQTMHYDPDHITGSLTHSLLQAAKRGLDARICTDDFCRHVIAETNLVNYPFLPSETKSYLKFLLEKRKQSLKEMEEAGVNVTIKSDSTCGRFLSQVKRDHRKIFVIDDIVFTGGLNLSGACFNALDFMFEIHNPSATNVFVQEFATPRTGKKNYSIRCSDDLQVLVDTGKFGDSLIYEKAVEMAKFASREICYLSDYQPTGELRRAISQAHARGVKVTTLTSSQCLRQSNLCNKITGKGIPETSDTVKTPEWLHAKVLVCDDRVLFGSHNLTPISAYAGTRELSVFTVNPDLADQVKNMVAQVKNNHGLYTVLGIQ